MMPSTASRFGWKAVFSKVRDSTMSIFRGDATEPLQSKTDCWWAKEDDYKYTGSSRLLYVGKELLNFAWDTTASDESGEAACCA